MKQLNERRVVAHKKIVNRNAKQLAQMIRKATTTNSYALQIIWRK